MNLVLSAAAGYDWKQLEVFIKSLRRCYYDKVVLIVNSPNIELIKKLDEFSIEFIDTDIKPQETYQQRYSHYFDYLSCNQNYSKVLLTDFRDVFFQNNPFLFNYKHNLNFFLEDGLIKDSYWNVKIIQRTVGKKNFKILKEKIISNGGIIIGDFLNILDYCKLMKEYITIFRYRPSLHSKIFKRSIKGWDQGIHIFLAYSNLLENYGFYNNSNGNVATLKLNKKINLKNNKLINDLGVEYSIIHQYDHLAVDFQKLFKI